MAIHTPPGATGRQPCPFVALDVLEHGDDIYFGFTELCRVSKRWVAGGGAGGPTPVAAAGRNLSGHLVLDRHVQIAQFPPQLDFQVDIS